MSKIKELIEDLERARDALDDAILDQMAEIAKQTGLTKMIVTPYGNSWYRDEEEVESKGLDKLDELYCDHVHAGGFQAIWTPEEGWQ